MSRFVCSLAACVLLSSASLVQAETLNATSQILLRSLDRSLDFTSDTTTSIRDSKVVRAARDDAASFVASEQRIRGAQLEAAFAQLREHSEAARLASDHELALAILAE